MTMIASTWQRDGMIGILDNLLLDRPDGAQRLVGVERRRAERVIREKHYTHSIPAGKSHYFWFEGAIVVFSIPANCNSAHIVLGRSGEVWELARLWAPDGHAANLLTRAISKTIKAFRRVEPTVEALVSYADPNVGHLGGIYRAASWIYQGQSEESRVYLDDQGQSYARRKFHSGDHGMTKAEIEASGFREIHQAGKHRFAFGLTVQARKEVRSHKQATFA